MSSMNRLTFDQFQATGIDSADLRKALPEELGTPDYPEPLPGRLYAGEFGLYLHLNPEHPERGTHYVEAGGSGLYGSLETCEAYLYGHYITECADRDARAELMALAPQLTRERWAA